MLSFLLYFQLGSPMAGIVEKVAVKVGQAVTAGDLLCVVSAMKMEVNVSAPVDGVVASIAVPNTGKHKHAYALNLYSTYFFFC